MTVKSPKSLFWTAEEARQAMQTFQHRCLELSLEQFQLFVAYHRCAVDAVHHGLRQCTNLFGARPPDDAEK